MTTEDPIITKFKAYLDAEEINFAQEPNTKKSEIVNEYIKKNFPFDEKPRAIQVFNLEYSEKYLPLGRYLSNSQNICTPNQIYEFNEIAIYLLKRLQSGEDESIKLVRDELAYELGFSTNTLDAYLQKLKSEEGLDILGSKVRIDELRHGKNTYDNTIHPVFLALNLTEVYFLTVKLPSLVKKDQKETALGIVGDVYRQLSDYAKAKMDHFISKESRKEQLKDIQIRGYRNEKKDILYYEKSGEMCSIELKDKGWLSGIILKGDDNSHYKLQNNNGEIITFTADDRISGPLQYFFQKK